MENVTNPMGVSTATPRLSWTTTWSTIGDAQASYDIQVFTNATYSGTAVWDSGTVTGGISRTTYGGTTALASGERYYWRVQATSASGATAGWSAESAWWSEALLTDADWRGARWISATAEPAAGTAFSASTAPLPAPEFRRAFTVNTAETVQWATASVAGLGLADNWLDGSRVDDHVLDPATTYYSKTALYVQHDLTAELTAPGASSTHVFGTVLGSGWYAPEAPDTPLIYKAPWVDVRKLRALITIHYTDGTEQYVTTTTGWTTDDPTQVTPDVLKDDPYQGETMTPSPGTSVTAPWNDPPLHGTGWIASQLANAPAGSLVGQVMPSVAKDTGTTLGSPNVITNADGTNSYVYKTSANMTGWAKITLPATTPAGLIVTIKYDEAVSATTGFVAGYLNNQTLVGGVSQGWQTDKVTTIAGTQTFEPRFSYKGFRYIEIDGLTQPPTLVEAYAVHNDVSSDGSFASSDSFLNTLHSADRLTYLNNLQNIPTDCPSREKLGWGADAALAAGNGLLNYDTVAFYERYLAMARDYQATDSSTAGSFPAFFPSVNVGHGKSPSHTLYWSGAPTMIAWQLYRFTGDTSILAQNYSMITQYVRSIPVVPAAASETDPNTGALVDPVPLVDATTLLAPKVLEGWEDWVAPKPTDIRQMTSAEYFLLATIAAKTAAAVGNTADATEFANDAATSRSSINAAWFDSTNHRYLAPTGRGATTGFLALAQALGLTPDGEFANVDAQLVASLNSTTSPYGLNSIPTGIITTPYLFRALAMGGHDDVAYQLINDTTPGHNSYATMLTSASQTVTDQISQIPVTIEPGGTIWETWDGGNHLGHIASHDHPAFSSVDEWLYSEIGGIGIDQWDPAAPLNIAPHPVEGITSASASIHVMGGTVSMSWTVSSTEFDATVVIPQGRTATMTLPWPGAVTVNGSVVTTTTSGGMTQISLSSGTSQIVVQSPISISNAKSMSWVIPYPSTGYTRTSVLLNSGTAPVTIDQIVYPSSPAFLRDATGTTCSPGIVLAPKDACHLGILVNPPSSITFTDTLRVTFANAPSVSVPLSVTAFVPTVVDDASSAVTYGYGFPAWTGISTPAFVAGWTASSGLNTGGWYAGTKHSARNYADSVTYTCTSCTRLVWYGTRGPDHGAAVVDIDDSQPGQWNLVDTYAPQASGSTALYTSGPLPLGTHTITVYVWWVMDQTCTTTCVPIPTDTIDDVDAFGYSTTTAK